MGKTKIENNTNENNISNLTISELYDYYRCSELITNYYSNLCANTGLLFRNDTSEYGEERKKMNKFDSIRINLFNEIANRLINL